MTTEEVATEAIERHLAERAELGYRDDPAPYIRARNVIVQALNEDDPTVDHIPVTED